MNRQGTRQKVTCRRRPSGVDNAALLHIGTEANRNLIEVAAQNGAVPHGSTVPDDHLAGQDDVGRHVSVDGDLGRPLPQRYGLSLAPVVPFHSIGRFPDDRRRIVGQLSCFSRESPARQSPRKGAGQQPSRHPGYSRHFPPFLDYSLSLMFKWKWKWKWSRALL